MIRLASGLEEREPLDVIPVRMGDKEVDLARRLGHHLQPQLANAGPGVEDDAIGATDNL